MGTFTYTVTEQGYTQMRQLLYPSGFEKRDFDVHVPACKRPDSYRVAPKPVVIASKVETEKERFDKVWEKQFGVKPQ